MASIFWDDTGVKGSKTAYTVLIVRGATESFLYNWSEETLDLKPVCAIVCVCAHVCMLVWAYECTWAMPKINRVLQLRDMRLEEEGRKITGKILKTVDYSSHKNRWYGSKCKYKYSALWISIRLGFTAVLYAASVSAFLFFICYLKEILSYNSIWKKVLQRFYFLHQIEKFNLPPKEYVYKMH